MSTPLPLPTPGSIGVASLSQAKRQKKKWDAIITCEDPNDSQRLRLNDRPQLVLAFEDCDDITLGYAVATHEQVERAIEFGRSNSVSSLLVHCIHGVGRSAAIALALIADRMGPGRENEAVARLLADRPEVTPNLVVTQYADSILNQKSALSNALKRSENANPAKLNARAARAKFARENSHLYAKA